MFGLGALLLAVALASFTTPRHARLLATQFKFTGSNSSQYTSASAWVVSSDPTGCNNGNLNCLVTPDDVSIDTPSELAAEISAHGFANIRVDATKH